MRLYRSGHQIPGDDAARLAVDHDEVEHLGARVHLETAAAHLSLQRLIGAEQQLLTCLSARVKRSRHLRAAERPVGQKPAVLTRERNSLSDALVDDVDAQLRQSVDIGLARTKVTTLDGVVEKPIDAVAVVLIILGGVDATLCGDAVGSARRILEAEALH